jgi:hypothetical protein
MNAFDHSIPKNSEAADAIILTVMNGCVEPAFGFFEKSSLTCRAPRQKMWTLWTIFCSGSLRRRIPGTCDLVKSFSHPIVRIALAEGADRLFHQYVFFRYES